MNLGKSGTDIGGPYEDVKRPEETVQLRLNNLGSDETTIIEVGKSKLGIVVEGLSHRYGIKIF